MRTEQLMSGNSAPNSPMAMLNINSSHEKEVRVGLLGSDISQQIQTKLHFKGTKFTNYLQKVDLVTFLCTFMVCYCPQNGIISTFYEGIIMF